LLTDEFQSHVKRLRFDPASVGGEVADSVHEAGDAFADGVVDVESEEEAHKTS
jgi:hypothetical protein